MASLGLRVAAMAAGSPPSSNSTILDTGAALEPWEDKGGVSKVLEHPVQRLREISQQGAVVYPFAPAGKLLKLEGKFKMTSGSP